ncbi:hypothetical protein ACIPUD_29810 [Bradyrhizobium sp. CAR08]
MAEIISWLAPFGPALLVSELLSKFGRWFGSAARPVTQVTISSHVPWRGIARLGAIEQFV